MSESQNKFSKISSIVNNWQTIIVFLLMIATVLANYKISDYRLSSNEEEIKELKLDIEKLENRTTKLEGIDYDLVIEQLKAIQETNGELNKKIERTNDRVDKVLQILVDR